MDSFQRGIKYVTGVYLCELSAYNAYDCHVPTSCRMHCNLLQFQVQPSGKTGVVHASLWIF